MYPLFYVTRAVYSREILSKESVIFVVSLFFSGISDVSVEIMKLVNYFDRYRGIWDMDKDAFIRRYSATQRPLSSFDMDITRYVSKLNIKTVVEQKRFVVLEMSPSTTKIILKQLGKFRDETNYGFRHARLFFFCFLLIPPEYKRSDQNQNPVLLSIWADCDHAGSWNTLCTFDNHKKQLKFNICDFTKQ